MYTQEDMKETKALLAKRWLLTAVPALLLLTAAVAIFVYGRILRSERMWMLTSLLTILGGGYFLFFYGVSVRPVRLYRVHLSYMLGDRFRTTTGVFKAFSQDVCDHDGLDCHSMLVNVGEKDDPEDDRLFYFDACKPAPDIEIGRRVTVLSNDKMVSSIKEA